MESIKAFFAKDIVKVIAAGVVVIITGAIGLMPEGASKQMARSVWVDFVLPTLAAWGIVSGGTSNLRSNASQAQTATLVDKGVVQPKA